MSLRRPGVMDPRLRARPLGHLTARHRRYRGDGEVCSRSAHFLKSIKGTLAGGAIEPEEQEDDSILSRTETFPFVSCSRLVEKPAESVF